MGRRPKCEVILTRALSWKIVFALALFVVVSGLIVGCSNMVDKFVVGLMPRPQEPKVRPYVVRQVTFPAGDEGVKLAGELTYPEGNGPFTTLVLVHGHFVGYPPADRNVDLGTEVGHKTFLVLSHLMTMRGCAVLRYDNRGIGESTGDWAEATDEVYATDAAAALKWLREESGLPIASSGYLGHSEGTVKAPLAAKIERPDFMVLLAGGVETVAEILRRQNYDAAKEKGWDKDKLDLLVHQYNDAFWIMRASKNRHEAARKVEQYLIEQGAPVDQARFVAGALNDAIGFGNLDTDPKQLIRAYNGPILYIYGGKDKLVSVEQNEEPTREVLVHPASELVVYPDLNHFLQPAKTGGMDEYWKIAITFDERVVDGIKTWLEGLPQQKSLESNGILR